MSIGRILRAAGWGQVDDLQPVMIDAGDNVYTAFDFGAGDYPVLTTSLPCEAFTRSTVAVLGSSRIGKTHAMHAALDACRAAGLEVEERDGGFVIHLPTTGGMVDGMSIVELLSPPIRPDDLFFPVTREPVAFDYLQHDPTKQHGRRRREARHPHIKLRRRR